VTKSGGLIGFIADISNAVVIFLLEFGDEYNILHRQRMTRNRGAPAGVNKITT
jgi:hypothetical protein